jgi:sulfatase maturation enzyme AslB (radical SAM superfamily)
MDYSFSLKDCESLTLITSETCNLKCSYCTMAKTTNKYKILETENIK